MRPAAFAAATACTCAAMAPSTASAFFGAEFVFLADDVVAVNGTGDVWGFRVYNNTNFDVSALNLSFTGNFINAGTSLQTETFLPEPAPGVFVLDTFFAGNDMATPLSVNLIDDGSTLSGELAITAPNVYLPAQSDGIVAVFSVPDGTVLTFTDNYNGGSAVVAGQFLDVPSPPEPATGALIILAGAGVIARRRRA